MSIAAVSSCLLAWLLLGSLTGCDARSARSRRFNTLADAVSSRADLSLLRAGLLTYPAEFNAAITDPNIAVTVFAPTDKAIGALVQKLGLPGWPAADSEQARTFIAVLQYHIVPAVAFARDVKHNVTVPTLLSGSSLTLDTLALKGRIVVRGRNSDAVVLQTDIQAAKSVIHIIDDVLLPVNPFPVPFTSIADAATRSGLTSLVAALQRANLVSTVANPSLVATVYAPTNKAFEKYLKANHFRSLQDVPVDALTKVLLYHVTGEYRTTGNMVANQRVATLFAGNTLKFKYMNFWKRWHRQSRLTIKAAKSCASIKVPDVFAGAGVVHVVDTVLVPNL